MSNIKDIDDFRSDDYWTKRMMETKVDKTFIYYRDMDDGDITDARIAFVRIFNLMHRLHEKGISAEDIFAGGFQALVSKTCDLADNYELQDKIMKQAHEEITKHYYSYLCCEKLGIDDPTQT